MDVGARCANFAHSNSISKGGIFFVATVPGFFRFFQGQLRKLKELGDITIVASPGETLTEIAEKEGVECLGVSIPRRIAIVKDIWALWSLFCVFCSRRPQMVHGNTPKGALLSMVAAFFARVPVRVFMCHGLCNSTERGLKRRIIMMMERVTCFFSTHIIAVSHGLKNELVESKFASADKVSLILNGCVSGVDLKEFMPGDKASEKIKLGWGGAFVFGFVGRIVRDKGIEELVDAFSRLSREYSEVRLILLGKIEGENAISNSALQSIQSSPSICYLGFQKNLTSFYQAMDCLVFPSYREGFGMVVAEAGASGVPCIVSDISGCNEIIREGENGTIIPPRDADALYRAMKRFYEERKTTLPGMASRSRGLIASRYEQRAVWDATLEMYRNLTDK